MATQATIKYSELTDEQIESIKRRIETFAKTNDEFDDLLNHEKWDRGTKTMQSRRVVKPKVKAEDIVPATENIAPRPQKIAVETFKHSVDVYRDKVPYTAEDVLFGYDDIVKMAGDTLSEITTQKLNLIKAKPFINSRCSLTYDTSCLNTLAKGAIILKKNGALTYSRGKYLAIVTPEILEKIRLEIETKGVSMSEPMKEEVEKGIVGGYGRWLFKETSNDTFYKSSTVQYMVLYGRRPNGQYPIDVAKIDGVEIIHNPLGSGVLVDADGNYTADDNKQLGSVAVNVNGLGAYVNDDLCVIKCEVTVNEIAKSSIGDNNKRADQTGYYSGSPVAVVNVNVTNSGATSITKTFKQNTSSGATVAENALKVGDTYYMTVSGTVSSATKTYTTTFVANATNYFEVTLA